MGIVVVGVDGSAGSDTALRWALAEARMRGSNVRLVHAYQSPQVPVTEAGLAAGMALPVVFTEDAEKLREMAEAAARNLMEEALRRADGESIAGLEIEQAAVEGPPAQALIDSAKGADLLVLGSRGRGGFLGLLLGSVSQQCAQHPPCPLVILPPPETGEPDTGG
jgi:nucleotide-binding universal stress UspA family protein